MARIGRPSVPDSTRLENYWSQVDKNGPTQPHMETPCWIWLGPHLKTGMGYGQTWYQGRTWMVHRLSWVLHFGAIPKREDAQPNCVLHRCDVPKCVNPVHLFLGSRPENTADMDAKGRRGVAVGDAAGPRKHPKTRPRGDAHHARKYPERLHRGDDHWTHQKPEFLSKGSAHPTAKLTEDDVREIRRRHAAGERVADLARAFGMSWPATDHIVKRRKWRHVE